MEDEIDTTLANQGNSTGENVVKDEDVRWAKEEKKVEEEL